MKQNSLFDSLHTDDIKPKTRQMQTPKYSAKVVAHSIKELAFDIEATGPDPMKDSIVGIALCREKGKAYYVPIRHASVENLPEALEILKSVLQDKTVPKIGHNLKYDISMLRREGIEVKGLFYDTMLAAYLLNPNRADHSLENTALKYLHHHKNPFLKVLGKRPTFAHVPLEEATQYAAEDAALAMELKEILFKELADEKLEDLYFSLEMPLISVLEDMENSGIKLNTDKLNDLSKELDIELSGIESKIYKIAGQRFNINSPQQLQKILFEHLGLKPLKKTKTGYSTGVDVLEKLALQHELPQEILNYRMLYKLKTTYIDSLPRLINPETGRIHTSFNQTVTATGRLSSSNPNLQNIPVRGEWGKRIREAFIADKGNVLISADYSQVELRILAHISKDAALKEAFKNGRDIHTETAAGIFGIPHDSVTADMRRIAKTVNFGVVYGMSPYGLSEALGITPAEAADYINRYFERHPGVKSYMEDAINTARETGYVTTLMGRKRQIPDINSSNSNIRQQAERLAINSPIQGTAADLIKKAMIAIHNKLHSKSFKTVMLLQIHDELLFEAPKNEVNEAIDLIKHEMEHAIDLDVPVEVEIGHGENWAEAH
jgi:DNA polymerase-1